MRMVHSSDARQGGVAPTLQCNGAMDQDEHIRGTFGAGTLKLYLNNCWNYAHGYVPPQQSSDCRGVFYSR